MRFLQKRDIPMDGPTDRQTDTPSYRDARTHLKIFKEEDELLNLNLQQENTPYAEIHQSLAA